MNDIEARQFEEETKQYGWVFGLDSIKGLMSRLGNVQEQLSIIHVAGTNGKGSVCAMLGSIFETAGYKTGRFQSPAVFDPFEVWSINGISISKEEYATEMTKVKAACEDMVQSGLPHPTTFEIQTALAFLYFYDQKCDRVIIETGLGGETDATNVIAAPLCSVLTPISMDHMNILGDTLEKIAAAKAGIMKAGSITVTASQPEEVMDIIERKAEELDNVKLVYSESERVVYRISDQGKLQAAHPAFHGNVVELEMQGSYQAANAVLAATVAETLGVTMDTIREGLKKAKWRGRFEQISENPKVFVDGAHNEGAAIQLESCIQDYFPGEKLIFIMGVLADKEFDRILDRLLPYAEMVYVTRPDSPRALSVDDLRQAIQSRGGSVYTGKKNAIREALQQAEREHRTVLAFGSLYALKDTVRQIEEYVSAKAKNE